MAKTNDEWELSKENIQPLKQGRTHGVLQVALSSQPDDSKIMHQQQVFEQELRTYSGDDPLEMWCNYIRWVEQNFPKGGRDGHIGKLIQRCLVVLKEDKKYHGDKRFIQIWLKYASMTVKPIEIYEYMFSHNIGCKAAILYTTWSWEVEQLGNIKKANQILLEGINQKAEPFDRLQAYYDEFESRVVKRVMTNPENTDDPENVDCRSAFSVLKSGGKKKNAPVMRTGENIVESLKPLTIGGQQPLPKRNTSAVKAPFKIYNAENIQPSSLPIQSENVNPFVLYSDQTKENEIKPSKWNKVRVKPAAACPSISSATPAFQLHCDEGPQPASTPRSVPKVSNILQPRRDCDSPPMALFEPPDPKKIPMYDRKKVYGGGEEFSLEEIRAASWLKKQKELEMERQLAEQQRKLKEQEEYIKNLQKQVDLLKNEKLLTPSVKENQSQSSCASQDSCPSNLMDLSHSVVKGTIRKELFPEPKMMNSFHEPTNVLLQELYNGTLSNSADALSVKQESFPSNPVQFPTVSDEDPFTQNGNQAKNTAFSFFSDPTEIQEKVNSSKHGAFSVVKSSATDHSKSDHPQEAKLTIFTDTTENHELVDVIDNTSFLTHDVKDDASFLAHDVKDDAPFITHEYEENIEQGKNAAFSFFSDPTEIQEKVNIGKLGAFSVVKSSATDHSKSGHPQEAKLTIFTDTTENHELVDVIDNTSFLTHDVKDDAPFITHEYEENIESEENEENLPPEGCVQDTTKRELSGILEPSKNVFFIPLEEQENEAEDLDSDDEIIHGENQPFQDVTIPPCNTEIFFAADICASTPRTQQRNMKKYPSASVPIQNSVPDPSVAAFETPNVENISRTPQETVSRNESMYKQAGAEMNQYTNTYPYTNLSVILESSREGYKSSSSSGSSAGATQLSHFYSYDKTKLVSKMETFKEPLPPAQIEKDLALSAIPEKACKLAQSVPDPFDNNVRDQILQSLYKSSDFNGIIRGSNKSARDLKLQDNIVIEGESYIVNKLIVGDHNGRVYEAACVDTPSVKVALKFCKQSSRWEFHICNALHQRLQVSGPPDVSLSVMKPIAGEGFLDSFIFVHEFCEMGTIIDFVHLAQQKSGEIPELIAMCIALELLLIVSKLHECEILHCDITPLNVLVQRNILDPNFLNMYPGKTAILKLIDFSQAVDLKLYEKGTCFQTPQYDYCIEMKEGNPWVHQLDWYGVLNCVHLLLFSDFMKAKKMPSGRWGIERRFRSLEQDIWAPMFDELLNLSCYQRPEIEKHIIKLKLKLERSSVLLNVELLTILNSFH